MIDVDKNKHRLQEIIESAKNSDVSTERLIELLDESIKIGNEICDASNEAIRETFKPEDEKLNVQYDNVLSEDEALNA